MKSEVNRAFAASIVDDKFRKGFLDISKRATTLSSGFGGKPFDLTQEELDVILTARGRTLLDLAKDIKERLGYDPFPGPKDLNP
jgi:hypothetical protein